MSDRAKYRRLSPHQKAVYNWVVAEQFKKNGIIDRNEAYKFVLSKSAQEIELLESNINAGTADYYLPKDEAIEIHRFGVMSDTHIGSVYTPDEWILNSIEDMQNKGCECILHCGDLTEGIKHARLETQMYEWRQGINSYPTMRKLAVKLMSGLTVPMYIISGNHDKFFQDNADIVRDVAEKVPNMHYLGFNAKVIEIGGIKIELFHGGDGFSNMRLKNLAFSEQLEHNDIKILLAGHVHKFEIKWIDHCYCVHVPCMQEQSNWMRAKKLIADTGYLIIDMATKNGQIKEISFNYTPLQ